MRRAVAGRTGRWGTTTLLILVFLAVSCGSPQAPQPQTAKSNDAVESAAAPSHIRRPDIGFASHQKLVDHYQKHGREFGAITMDQYQKRAQEFRDRPAGGAVLENERPDGTVTRFDRESGDFIAFNKNGIIRTYFRPVDGEGYYRRQLGRRH